MKYHNFINQSKTCKLYILIISSLKTFIIIASILTFLISCSNIDEIRNIDYTYQVPDAVGNQITEEDLKNYTGNYNGSLTLDMTSLKLSSNPPNAFATRDYKEMKNNVSITIEKNNISYNTGVKELDDIYNDKPVEDIIITNFLKAPDGSFQANYYGERMKENDYTNKIKYFIKITLDNNNATVENTFSQFHWNIPGKTSIISYSELATFNGIIAKEE